MVRGPSSGVGRVDFDGVCQKRFDQHRLALNRPRPLQRIVRAVHCRSILAIARRRAQSWAATRLGRAPILAASRGPVPSCGEAVGRLFQPPSVEQALEFFISFPFLGIFDRIDAGADDGNPRRSREPGQIQRRLPADALTPSCCTRSQMSARLGVERSKTKQIVVFVSVLTVLGFELNHDR